MEVGLGPGHMVLDWDPANQRDTASNFYFWPMSAVGQAAGWIKMPLGTEEDLGPGHVLDGNPAIPHEKGTAARSPLFSVHVYCG